MQNGDDRYSSPTASGALVSGAIAGLGVDLTLYPLDTLKTRLQSKEGFRSSGGFHRLWAGIGAVAVGSAPGAAMFFVTYEASKKQLKPVFKHDASTQMMSASFGELAACLVRVPVEVVKQRMQVSHQRGMSIVRAVLQTEGFQGMFRGYSTTVMREVPFSFIQMPLWEYLKKVWAREQNEPSVKPWQSGVCGAVAGGFSAAVTTPLDVAKTRIMLAESGSELAKTQSAVIALREVFETSGVKGLFAGVTPRVAWISIGGALFLGLYDFSVESLSGLL